MNSFDETMLMSLFAMTQQKVIAQDIFDSYNTRSQDSIKSALNDAAWRGFVSGIEATKRYYSNKV